MMERNSSLDFIKFLFILIIVLHHFQGTINTYFIYSGYLCVEMFFMISGFFLYKKYQRSKNKDAFKYTADRIKKLYPMYIIGLILMFIIKKLNVYYLPQFLVECFLIQGTGITTCFGGNLNYPCWYLSVMLIGGYFIYKLLEMNKDFFFKFIAPLIAMLTFTYLNGKIESFSTASIFYLPLWRGIAGMCVGVMLAYFVDTEYFKKISDFFKANKPCFYIIEIVTYVLVAILIVNKTAYEISCVFLFPVIILFTQFQYSLISKVFNKRIFSKINRISYPMFVLHAPFIQIFSFFVKNKILTINNPCISVVMLYLPLALVSLCCIIILDKLKKLH